MFIIVAFAGSLAGLAYWYQHLPITPMVQAKVTVPEITPNTEDLVPNRLSIDFISNLPPFGLQSVAPLGSMNKALAKGVDLRPKIPGSWAWETDNRLVFTPEKDWPAGTQYQVHFAKDFFNAQTKMESNSYSFITRPFEAKISEFILYQNPKNPAEREAVATVDFNFPVDKTSFEERASVHEQGGKGDSAAVSSKAYPIAISYDANLRRAFVHSTALNIGERPHYLVLTVEKGLRALASDDKTQSTLTKSLLIPDASTYFRVQALQGLIVRNAQDRPEQVLALETSLGLSEKDLNPSLHAFVLPKNKPATRSEKEETDYQWTNPGAVTAEVLAKSEPLALEPIPADRSFATLHSYKLKADPSRYVFVKVDKGLVGFGGFVLANDYSTIIKAPEIPKEISFLHKGALLALSSEKKLSVLVRGLPAVKFTIARVLPNNINQLVTQTEGDFNNPYFLNQSFNQDNISELFSELRSFDSSNLEKQNYTSLDLEKYLNTSSTSRGLFLLKAVGYNEATKEELDIKASRLVLITDMGMIVKDNNDGSHEVFVQSIAAGTPIANVLVSVLGKNGQPIASRTSDAEGHVAFPSLKDFIEDREPTVYSAQNQDDLSFIPYNKMNRMLNYSKFDIGGKYSNTQELGGLSAFIFTDRGIYRPGDKAHIAMIVKSGYTQKPPSGLPLQVIISDPRGNNLLDEKVQLDDTGLLTVDFPTSDTFATGQYSVMLYTVKDANTDNLLGSANFRVEEFQPDRMRIKAAFSEPYKEAWLSPYDLKAKVLLANLYGAPAVDRRIASRITLKPQEIAFPSFKEYVFVDPLQDATKKPKTFSEDLSPVKTNAEGEAILGLNLDKFEKASYQLSLFVEGFEAEGGRSVSTALNALISPRPYFIGFKPDGDLRYIKQNEARGLHFIAIDPALKTQALSDLKVQLAELYPVSTLIKKDNGTYEYQSIMKSKILETKDFQLNQEGQSYALPTANIGNYQLTLLDKDNLVVSRLSFSVVGQSQKPLPKNAEMTVTLDKEEYQPGEDIHLQISAPYTGSGLISIERDRLYKSQWFKADTTNSVQTIHIPEDFEGNGYINVAFVRDWNSPEIFISPLSYNVVPFKVSHAKHDIQIELQTADLARPGEPFTIGYQSDKPGKIIVYAVDEGILQVAKYHTPNPQEFFFAKRALEVSTLQTLDQILPNYLLSRELSSVGGDDSDEIAHHLNPFKRKTDLPVVFWSGIVDTDEQLRELHFPIPDYFNGSLRVMAVAVNDDALGHAERLTEVRGNFVINPNVPTFVAPKDTFEITVSVANNVKDSGKKAEVSLVLGSSPAFELIGSNKESLIVPEGQERSFRFKLRAKPLLGPAQLDFVASLGDKASRYSASVSVRPASSFMTSIKSAYTTDASVSLPLERNLYQEHRKVQAEASFSPLILVSGLTAYLENFPYGCTEQLVSKAFPLLAMTEDLSQKYSKEAVVKKVEDTVRMLTSRQASNGSFAYWPEMANNDNNAFISVYAMHFLTEARLAYLGVPDSLFFSGIAYLKELVATQPKDFEAARVRAYAIYLLTRNEIVTSAYVTHLQSWLEENAKDIWKKDITGSYLAATYQLLKSQGTADALIGQYQSQNKDLLATDFNNASLADAQYLYLLSKHFPERLQDSNKLILPLVYAMNTEQINTILSSYISLALKAYAEANHENTERALSLIEIRKDKTEETLAGGKANYQQASLGAQAASLKIENPEKTMLFYQMTQAGFDKTVEDKAIQEGIEIFREYRDKTNQVIDSTSLGSEIEVHIKLRALDNRSISNIAIVDLLPGGFEAVSDSVRTDAVDYSDLREDRALFFLTATADVREIVYRIKATNTGEFIVPGIFAESLYFPGVRGRGMGSKFKITSEQKM